MPHAVETSHYGCDGNKEGVAEPYNEHGVFLSESLSSADAFAVSLSYLLADNELENAAAERYDCKPKQIPHADGAVYNTLRSNCDGKCE